MEKDIEDGIGMLVELMSHMTVKEFIDMEEEDIVGEMTSEKEIIETAVADILGLPYALDDDPEEGEFVEPELSIKEQLHALGVALVLGGWRMNSPALL